MIPEAAVDNEGVYMTEAEFQEAIRAAKEEAFDEGGRAALDREHAYGAEEKAQYDNPYRSQP